MAVQVGCSVEETWRSGRVKEKYESKLDSTSNPDFPGQLPLTPGTFRQEIQRPNTDDLESMPANGGADSYSLVCL
jgi:hypothetical protein